MISQIRNSLLCFGALALTTVAACNSDAKPSTPDILAQDSTLNLKVMAAKNDSSSDTAIQSKQVARTPAAATVSAKPTAAPVLHPVAVASQPSRPVRTLSNSAESRTVSSSRARRISRSSASRARLASSVSPRYSHRRAARTVYASAPARISRPRVTTATTTAAAQVPSAASSISTAEAVAPAPRGNFFMVPTGSSLALASSQKVCTNTSKVGQQFETRLTKDVMGPDGVLIPEGTVATGRIASIDKSDPGITVNISSLNFGGRTYPIDSHVTYAEVDRVQTSSRNSGAKIVAGAGLGALIGRMIGGDTKSTVIGAVGGAAAGGVLANAGTTQYAHCVPSGGQIVARLTEPLRLASAN